MIVMEDSLLEQEMRNWRHIFKLDPAKKISDQSIKRICKSGTDAVIVGGTDGVTLDGVLDLLFRLNDYDMPCILEVSEEEAIAPGFDYYFIPMVLNSKEKKWMMDIQHQAIKQYKGFLKMMDAFFLAEGYCILNEECKAFKKTNCQMPSEEDVVAYAYMAEHLLNLPIFYIEYSGMYGNPELVRKVKTELNETLLFYGGGIETKEQAREMKKHADVIIVGNIIYTNLQEALETVSAVKG